MKICIKPLAHQLLAVHLHHLRMYAVGVSEHEIVRLTFFIQKYFTGETYHWHIFQKRPASSLLLLPQLLLPNDVADIHPGKKQLLFSLIQIAKPELLIVDFPLLAH